TAGMAGVRGGYELPEEATGNLFDRGAGRDLELLPTTLKDATDRMAGSTLLHDTLGEHLVEWFLRNKRAEWSAYAATVTPFELDRYLPLL
ncbi:MAG TPA: glutamine synthetase, partial [Acidimicrobiales bacterium]|nr:glutamine synthetase [Acidimicrobiales bacterium]